MEKVFGIILLQRFQLETRALALIKVALGLDEGARIRCITYVVHLSSVGAFLSDSCRRSTRMCSPLTFNNIILDSWQSSIRLQGVQVGANVHMSDLAYADDNVILSGS